MYVHISFRNYDLADRTLIWHELTNQQLDDSTTLGRVNSDVATELIMHLIQEQENTM